MATTYIDLSLSIEPDLPSDPEMMIPAIEYVDHEAGAKQMEDFFPGLKKEQLPKGLGWSLEFVRPDDPFGYPPGCPLSLSSNHGPWSKSLDHRRNSTGMVLCGRRGDGLSP